MREVRGKAAAACALRSLMCVRVARRHKELIGTTAGGRGGCKGRSEPTFGVEYDVDAPLQATVRGPPRSSNSSWGLGARAVKDEEPKTGFQFDMPERSSNFKTPLANTQRSNFGFDRQLEFQIGTPEQCEVENTAFGLWHCFQCF